MTSIDVNGAAFLTSAKTKYQYRHPHQGLFVPTQCIGRDSSFCEDKDKIINGSLLHASKSDDRIVHNEGFKRTDNRVVDHQKNRDETVNDSNNDLQKQAGQRRRRRSRGKGNNRKGVNSERGYIPNISWRAFTMDELRLHPYFDPLPHPSQVCQLSQIRDVCKFRQDSIQWDLLHEGRCTTSRAACALGVLEDHAANELGIPKSLRKRGVRAYDHLLQEPLRTLSDMDRVLCNEELNEEFHQTVDSFNNVNSKDIWYDSYKNERFDRTSSKFMARYKLKPMLKDVLSAHRKSNKREWSVFKSRVQWGSTQEATAILTALNYICRSNPGARVKEVGMCTGESSGFGMKIGKLLIGASPDAVIAYPNGTCEVLEVKNHCPFVPLYWNKSGMNEKGVEFFVGSKPPPGDIPPVYVPQLMMEMLCLGIECRSAVMVRQTATKGASLIRLRRDDLWIEEMLYFLNKFQEEFVEKRLSPPPNFFWNDSDGETRLRYRNFVNRTKEIGRNVETIASIPNRDVQRVVHYTMAESKESKGRKESRTRIKTPLFLDRVT